MRRAPCLPPPGPSSVVVDLRAEPLEWAADEVQARLEHAVTVAVRYMLLPGLKPPTPRWPRWLLSVDCLRVDRPPRWPDHIAPQTIAEMEEVLRWPGTFLAPKSRPAVCLRDWLRCRARDASFTEQAKRRGFTVQSAARWRNVGCEIIADGLNWNSVPL